MECVEGIGEAHNDQFLQSRAWGGNLGEGHLRDSTGGLVAKSPRASAYYCVTLDRLRNVSEPQFLHL